MQVYIYRERASARERERIIIEKQTISKCMKRPLTVSERVTRRENEVEEAAEFDGFC
jgi:hypothetical protein